ncbi:predicted protein [Lichtheimia corymbifera JMRC:FSU:9682]|uniref:Uncharacterized protein n=1 Tax=Lichtheimia corymbifera JMRC:FSU:9682 TaxID=1263082 RepID=A0A068RYX2_9FUNG|nr:predicted protein [Lichtheimia corymbifera JMRC:FSU:9682]
MTNVTSKATSSSTAEESEKLNLLKADLRSKIPGLEYLEGDKEFRLTQAGLINLLNDVLGTDGWQQEMRDVSKQQVRRLQETRMEHICFIHGMPIDQGERIGVFGSDMKASFDTASRLQHSKMVGDN